MKTASVTPKTKPYPQISGNPLVWVTYTSKTGRPGMYTTDKLSAIMFARKATLHGATRVEVKYRNSKNTLLRITQWESTNG